MRKRIPIGLAVLVALAGIPATAAAKAVVQPSALARSTTVSPGEDAGFDLACRGAAVALGGAVSTTSDGAFVRGTIPSASRAGAWEYVLDGAGLSGGAKARADLRCLSVVASGATLRVSTNRSAVLSVAAGEVRGVAVRCTRGFIPTGYGVVGDGEIRLGAAVPGRAGWRFRLENIGARRSRAVARIRCLQRRVTRSRGGTLTFRVRRATFSDSVAAGAGGVGHSCRASEFSLATGVELAANDDVVLTSSSPRGVRGGAWRFGQGTGSAQVKTHLLCLAPGSRFR